MKVILSSPANNSNCKSLANGLVNADLLDKYYTSIAIFPGSILDRLGRISAFSDIRRKNFDPKLKPHIKTFPTLEIGRKLSGILGLPNLVNREDAIFSINKINLKHDKRVSTSLANAKKKGLTGIYCFEDVASFSFKEAKRLGLKTLYELPIGYWRSANKLLKEEQERWPEWANTIVNFEDSEEKLKRKDDEIRQADRIFVASSFTAKTLEEYPGKLPPVEIIPYGFPTVIKEAIQNLKFKNNFGKPLKLLFVGSLTQRKGIADLFAAVENVKEHVQLTIVGNKITNNCEVLDVELAKHTWIPTMSHSKILELMQGQDILVFPSLFEGFGLVITEAMSQGTPVITTDRTAGKEFIKHGQNGWLVEAGSTIALKEQIEALINQRKLIEEVSREALMTAKTRNWEQYSKEIAEAVSRELMR